MSLGHVTQFFERYPKRAFSSETLSSRLASNLLLTCRAHSRLPDMPECLRHRPELKRDRNDREQFEDRRTDPNPPPCLTLLSSSDNIA